LPVTDADGVDPVTNKVARLLARDQSLVGDVRGTRSHGDGSFEVDPTELFLDLNPELRTELIGATALVT